MTAFLGMYDRAETQAAHDALWAGIRARLGFGPQHLSRDRDPWDIWRDPELVFAQTCGLPFRSGLHKQVRLVATPDYAVEDCPPGYYCSVLVARRNDDRDGLSDFADARFAYNDPLSQSGWAAPAAHIASLGLPLTPTLRTGAHRASAQAVAENAADFAALDAVSWRMMQRWDPLAADLREIGRTAPTPGLPYITGPDRDAAALRRATAEAIAALDPQRRSALGLTGLVEIPVADYLAVPMPPAP